MVQNNNNHKARTSLMTVRQPTECWQCAWLQPLYAIAPSPQLPSAALRSFAWTAAQLVRLKHSHTVSQSVMNTQTHSHSHTLTLTHTLTHSHSLTITHTHSHSLTLTHKPHRNDALPCIGLVFIHSFPDLPFLPSFPPSLFPGLSFLPPAHWSPLTL